MKEHQKSKTHVAVMRNIEDMKIYSMNDVKFPPENPIYKVTNRVFRTVYKGRVL